MKISNKMSRGVGIAAGVIMLLLMVFSSITSVISLFTGYLPTEYIVTSIVTLILNDIILTLMAIMLIRGKKDVLAGVMFILAAVYMLISSFRGVIVSLDSGYIPDSVVASIIIASVADLAGVAFRILIAVECFKPGAVSGSGAKILMILLPILTAVIAAVSTIVNALGFGYDTALIVTNIIVAVVSSVVSLIPQFLMALAVSIPVREAVPAPQPAAWQHPNQPMQ